MEGSRRRSDDRRELYDYRADAGETKNLAATRPEILAQLRALRAPHPEAKPQIKAAPAMTPTATPTPAPTKAQQAHNATFDRRDKDHDGKLSLAEFLDGQSDPAGAPKRFPAFDTNKDGFVSREEFLTSTGKGPKK